MLSTIKMPQMGVSDESAVLSKWLVREGGRIRKDQPVFSLETDKATFQCEAESDGFLVCILTCEGEEAAVGSPVGIISDSDIFEKTELETLLRELKTADERKQVQTEVKTEIPRKEQTETGPEQDFVRTIQNGYRSISRRARKKADELGLDMNSICSGSGPNGRIIERDVLNTVQTDRTGSEPEQKTINIWPGRPLTVENRINMRPLCADGAGQTGFVSRLVDARKILVQCTPQNKLTPGAAVCHELARLLARMPELNARCHGDKIYEYGTVHLRLTIETRFGTLKPVIRCAEAYEQNELAVLMRNTAERCKQFTSKPQEFLEGTFSVADLNGYGVDCFTPELMPPELCTLGIGAISMQKRLNDQGGVEAYPAIRLTLAYDRAGVDALRAAKFLNELALRLEPGGISNRTKQYQPHIRTKT